MSRPGPRQPILFTDIDGVLRPVGPYNGQMDTGCLAHFNAVCRHLDARIVISSSWRSVWSLAQFNEAFDGRVIGATPDLPPALAGEYDRWGEIRAWMDEHFMPMQWLAIDDDRRGFPPHCRHVHFTDPALGLTGRDSEQIIARLAPVLEREGPIP